MNNSHHERPSTSERPSIAVIILTYNQRQKALAVVESLLAIPEPPFQVLVWDNGSQDDTVAVLQRAFPGITVHQHSQNLGVASGRNAAAALAAQLWQPTHLLFLDNDMRLEADFVSGLYAPFVGDTAVGQTQAKLRFMHDPQRLNDGGGNTINFTLGQFMPVGFNEIDRGQYDAIKPCICCGGAMMVRRDVFEHLGGFDAIFDPFGPEDADFSLRLQKAGYRALYTPQAVAYHEVSHTYGKGYSENYARHKSRHWFTFMRRHASPGQKAAFFLIGAPYLALHILIREGKKGNLGAIRGLARGSVDFFRSASLTKK
ncbi:MAG: glycosyltransferase family 2 protein [Anaerolineae bacterium]|nr:glycosyltransferase family 2 protein [Anaerolineae bacterium]